MEMTPAQRLILSNQYTLMSQLDPSNASTYQRLKTIVERGYTLQIKELNKDFGDMSEAKCLFVLDIMEMYHALQESHNILNEVNQQEIEARRLVFWGFDSQTENELMHYVRFLTDVEGKYPQFEKTPHHFNSQVPMTEKYTRMLKQWHSCPRKYHLCINEICQILNA